MRRYWGVVLLAFFYGYTPSRIGLANFNTHNNCFPSFFFFPFSFTLSQVQHTRGGTVSVARGNTIPVAPVTVYDAVGTVTAHVLGRARWYDVVVAGQQRGHEFYYREAHSQINNNVVQQNLSFEFITIGVQDLKNNRDFFTTSA